MASPNAKLQGQRSEPSQLPDVPSTPPVSSRLLPRVPIPQISPTGWARIGPPYGRTEKEEKIYQLAKKIEQTVYLPWGVQQVYRIPPLEDDAFLEVTWPLVMRGLSEDSGVKATATEDALHHAPGRMIHGDRTLVPYQLQDAGQLARIEREMGTAFMLHATGLGKTLQAIAICEHNRVISQEPHGPTLIVAPPDATLDQWLAELRRAVPGASVCDYRLEEEKAKWASELEKFDYVVASMTMVSRGYEAARICAMDQRCRQLGEDRRTLPLTSKQKRQAIRTGKEPIPETVALTTHIPRGPLHNVHWDRVVLDGAHRLGRNTAMARAMCALPTKNSLILTEMPQQDQYFEWFPLFNLARLRAFRNNPGGFRALFRNKRDDEASPQLDIDRKLILSSIVRGLSLRREASTLFNGVTPNEPILHTEILVEVSPDDGMKYRHHLEYGLKKSERGYQQDSIDTWDDYATYIDEKGQKRFRLNESCVRFAEGRLSGEHPFEGIFDSRQAAINPLILVGGALEDDSSSNSSSSDEDESDSTDFDQWYQQKQRHAWYRWMKEGKKWRSSVIDKVVEIVKVHLARKPRDPSKLQRCEIMGPGGIIILSEHIRALDVVEMAVKKELRRNCLRRDGTIKGRSKQKVLEDFRKQANAHHMILLATPKSLSEGLNLTEAATVIQVSPSFNPLLDKQAQSRPLRRGQTERVEIYTIVMKDSFEQRIDLSQYRKANNASGTLDVEWQAKMTDSGLSLDGRESYLEMVSDSYTSDTADTDYPPRQKVSISRKESVDSPRRKTRDQSRRESAVLTMERTASLKTQTTRVRTATFMKMKTIWMHISRSAWRATMRAMDCLGTARRMIIENCGT